MAKEKLSPQMIQFMTELADLLEKHSVEFNGREKTCYYSTYMDGIDVDQDAIYDDGDVVRPYASLEMGSYISADVIRNAIAKDAET